MFNKLAVILAALWLSGCATHVITSGRFAVRDNPTSVEIAFTSHDLLRTGKEIRGWIPTRRLPDGDYER